MSKLNPNDLVVSSFETDATPDLAPIAATYQFTCNDPTAQTRCFICPPFTSPERGCTIE